MLFGGGGKAMLAEEFHLPSYPASTEGSGRDNCTDQGSIA